MVPLQEQMPRVLASNHVPGAVVSYIKNGEVAWTKAFGVANLQTGSPMRPDMVFNHGSDGKVLTAWAMMRLVEAGMVELDAPANSGGGFVIAQMIIEDVSGESFATFMEREVAKPLGLSSLEWVWTSQLERRAPIPYDHEQNDVGYRQLACQDDNVA